MHDERTQIPFHHLGIFLVVFVAFLAWFPSPQVRTIQQVAAANCTPGSDGCSNMALPPADGNINKTVDAKTQQAKEDPEPQNGKSYTTSALIDSKEKAKAAEAAAKKEAADVAAAEAKLNAANAKSNYLPGVAAERAVARNQLLSERVQKAKADAEKKRADEDLKDRETHPGRRRLIGEKGDVIKDCTVSTCKAEDLQGWANKPAADGGAVAPSAGGTSALAPQTSTPLAGTVLSTPGSAGVDPFASQSANSGSGAPAPLAPSASPMDVAKASLGADTTAGQQGPALGAPSGSLGGLSPSGSSGLAGTTLGPANPVTGSSAANTFGQGGDTNGTAPIQSSLFQSAKSAVSDGWKTIEKYAGGAGTQESGGLLPLAKADELRATLESGKATSDVIERERDIAKADVTAAQKAMSERGLLTKIGDSLGGASAPKAALADAQARLDMLNAARHESVLASNQKDLNASLGLDQNYKPVIGPAGDHPGSQPIPLSYRMQNREDLAGAVTVAKDKVDAVIDGEGLKKTTVETKSDVNSNGAIQESVTKRTVLTSPFVEQAVTDAQRAIAERDAFLKQSIADGKIVSTSKGLSAVDSQTGARYQELTTAATDAVSTMERTQQAYERSIARVQDAQGELARAADTYVSNEAAIAKTRADALAAAGVDIAGKPISNAERASVLSQTETRPAQPFSGTEISPLTRSQVNGWFGITRSDSEAYQANSAAVSETLAKAYATQDRQIDALSTCRTDCDSVRASLQNSQQLIQQLESGNYQNAALKDILALRSHQLSAGPDSFGETFRRVSNDIGEVGTAIVKEAWTGKDASGRPVETSAGELLGGLAATLGSGVGHTTAYVLGENNLEGAREALLTGGTTAYAQIRDNEKVAVAEGVIMSSLLTPKFVGPSPVSQMMSDAKAVFSDIARSEYQGLGSSIFGAAERTSARAGSEVAGGIASDASRAAEYSIPYMSRPATEVAGLGGAAAPSIEKIIAGAPAINGAETLTSAAARAETVAGASRVPGLTSLSDTGVAIPRGQSLVGASPLTEVAPVASPRLPGVADIGTSPARAIGTAFDAAAPAEARAITAGGEAAVKAGIPAPTVSNIIASELRNSTAAVPVGALKSSQQVINDLAKAPIAADSAMGKALAEARTSAPLPAATEVAAPRAPPRTLGQWFQDQLGLGKSFSGTSGDGALSEAAAGAPRAQGSLSASAEGVTIKQAKIADALDVVAKEEPVIAQKLLNGEPLSTQAGEVQRLDTVLNANRMRFSSSDFADNVSQVAAEAGAKGEALKQQLASSQKIVAGAADVSAAYAPRENTAVAWAKAEQQLVADIQAGKVTNPLLTYTEFYSKNMQELGGADLFIGQKYGVQALARGENIVATTGAGKTIMEVVEMKLQKALLGDKLFAELAPPKALAASLLEEKLGGQTMAQRLEASGFTPRNITESWAKDQEKAISLIKNRTTDDILILDPETRGAILAHADQTKDAELIAALNKSNRVTVDEYHKWLSNTTANIIGTAGEDAAPAVARIARVDAFTEAVGMKPGTTIGDKGATGWDANLQAFRTEKGWGTAAGDLRLTKAQWEAEQSTQAIMHDARPMIFANQDGVVQINQAGLRELEAKGFPAAGVVGSADNKLVSDSLTRLGQRPGQANGLLLDAEGKITVLDSSRHAQPGLMPQDTDGLIAWVRNQGGDPAKAIQELQSSVRVAQADVYRGVVENGGQIRGMTATYKGVAPLEQARIGNGTTFLSSKEFNPAEQGTILANSRTAVDSQVERMLASGDGQRNIIFAFEDPKLETSYLAQAQAKTGPFKDFTGDIYVQDAFGNMTKNGTPLDKTLSDSLKTGEKRGSVYFTRETEGYDPQGFNSIVTDVRTYEGMGQATGRANRYGMTGEYGATDAFGTTLQDAGGKPLTDASGNLIKGYWPGEKVILADETRMADTIAAAANNPRTLGALKIMEDGGGAGTSLLEKEIAGKRLTSEETVTLYSKLRQADQIENAVKGDLAREIRDERSVRFFDGLSKDSRIAPEHQAIAQDIKSALENQTGAGRDLGGVAAANTKDPADAFLNNLNKNATAEARQAIAEFEARVKASGVAPNTALENQVAAKLEKLDEWSKVDFTKTPLSKGGEAFSSSQSVAEHAATQKRLSQAITSVDMPLERKNVTISVTPEAAPAAVPTLSSFVADSAQGAAKAAVDTSVSTARGVVDGVVHAGAVTAEIAGLLATGDVKKAADAFAGALTEGFSSVIGANENFPTPTVHAQMNVAANDTTVEDVSAARGRIIADAQAKIDAIQASAGTSPQARDEANVNERANAVRAERDSALAQLDTAQQTPPGAVVSPLGTAAKVMTNAVASLVPGLGTASAVSQSSIPTAALKTIQTIADRIAGWLGFGSATDLADVTPGDSLDSTEETNAIAMLNQITERAGMPVLVRNASLAYAAKLYAPVMGFDADGKPLHVPVEGNTPAYRGGKAGYGTAAAPGAGQTLVGENLAAGSGFTDFSAVISAWMQSPAHRAVLLNADVRDIGIGYAVVGGETRWVVMVGVRDFHGTVTEARPVSSLLQDTPTSVSIGGAANEGSLTTAVAVPSSDIEATLRAALPGSMVPASVQNVDPRLQEMDARLQQLEEKIRALQTENGQCIDPSMGQGASAALALVDCSPVSIQQRNEQIASLIQEAQQLDSDLKALKMGPQSAAPAESKMAASPPSPTASVPSTQNITDTGQPGGATAPTARPITQTSAPAEASASKGDGTAVIQYTAPVTPLGQFLVDNALSLAENVSAPFAWRNAAYYRSIKLALDGSDIAPNEPVRLLYHRHAAAALAESHDVMAALESAGVPQATRNDVEAAYEAVTGTYTSITGMVITSRGDIDRPVLSQLDADVAQELTLARQRALESGADVGVIRQAIQRANQQATHDALTLYAIAHHYPDGADIVARLAANDPTLITQGQPGTTAQGFVANRTAPTALAQALRAAAFAGLTIAQTLSGTPGSIATTPTPQQQGTSVATQVQQDDMQILAPIIAVAEQARAQAIDAQTPFAAVTPLAQENVRFLDTAFKDTVAGKLADAAERGRRLAILKQVVASRIAAGGLTYPEFLLMNDIGAALTGIQTPLSATREIFPASWQSSQMDSTSQMADFSALALALRGTPAQGFDLDNLMIPVAQKAITARIANYAVARGIHLGGLSAGVLPVAVDGRFFDTFTLLQHDYVHRADFLAAYNALSIAQRAGFRNLYLSWYNSAGSIAHDTRDKADLIFFTLWHEPRMADARWAANGADTSVQSLPYDSSSLASASARLQGGFTSAAAAQEGTLAWRFAQKDNLRIVLPGDLYAMDTPAPGTNVPSQSEVDAKVAAHLQSANDAFRDAFTPIAMALRSPPSVLNRLSMAVSAARASTATSALNSGGAAFFEAMFNAYIAAGRPASATDPRMANEAYLEEATTRMATDIAAAETPEEKAAALANAEEVMRTIARLSTDFDIGPDGRLVSTAVSEAYWRRAQQNLAAAQELNRTTTDRVLAFVRRFAPGLFAGSAVALASGIDPATIADIATQAGSALASYLTPDSTAGGVLATLGLMPAARTIAEAPPIGGSAASPADQFTNERAAQIIKVETWIKETTNPLALYLKDAVQTGNLPSVIISVDASGRLTAETSRQFIQGIARAINPKATAPVLLSYPVGTGVETRTSDEEAARITREVVAQIPDGASVLITDDTVMTGNSLRPLLKALDARKNVKVAVLAETVDSQAEGLPSSVKFLDTFSGTGFEFYNLARSAEIRLNGRADFATAEGQASPQYAVLRETASQLAGAMLRGYASRADILAATAARDAKVTAARNFLDAQQALRLAEAEATNRDALALSQDAYKTVGSVFSKEGLGVDGNGDVVDMATDAVVAYKTAGDYVFAGTPEWERAKFDRTVVATAPVIEAAGAPLLESPDGAPVSDAEGKTSTPMPGVPAGLSPLTPAGLKALDTIAQNFQAEDFARANGYTIRSKAPGPIAALFGVPASDWYYKGDTPVGPVENPAAAPDGYTSLPRQVANSSFGKALQVVMPLTLISPAPVLQATVAAGDIASSVVVGSLHVLGDIVGLSPAQSAELPRDVVAQTVVEPKMASPLVLPLISKGPQVDFNVTLAEVYQQSKVKNGNHPGTDLYPWAKYSSEERAMAVAYQTHNPAGMKWPFIFELMGAPGGQPGPYADFFNVARMGADGQVDPTSVIAGKINIVPSKTPFVSFVSFADAEAAMAMKLAYQSEYKNVKTFGDVVRNWVAVDNVSPYLNSGSYTTQAKISGDTPLIRTTNNLIDPAQMARIGIGMPYAEYSNLFKNAGVKHPITGEPVTTAAQLITPEVQRDGLFKVYERVQPGAADAWLADQKRIAAEKATAPASVAKEAAGKSNVSTPPTAPRVTATADEKKEAKAKELVAQWRAKKQVGFGPAVAARLVLDGYDDTQEYVNWRDAAAKQLAGRATVEAPSSTELGIADTLIKLNVRYDVSFAEMAAELSRRGLITSAQYKTLRGFIADGLAQKAGRATTDADRIAADAAIANEMDPTLGHQVTKSGRIYFPGVEYVYELPQGFGTPAERIASKKEGHIMHQVGGWAKDHIARFKTNALRGAGVRVPFLIGDGRGSNDGAVFVFAPNTQEMSWKDNWQGRFLFGGMERESSKLLSTEVGGNAPNIGLTNPLTKAQERAILVNVAFTELAYGFGPAAVVAHNNEENACEGCPGAVLAQELGSVNPYATVSKLIAFADKSVAARAVALAGADAKPSPKTPGTVVIPKGTTLVDSAQFFASLPAATTFLTIAQAGLVSERLISEKVAEAQKTAGMPEVETDQLTGLVKVTEASGEQFVTLKGNGSRLKVVPPKSGNGVYEFRPVEASPVKTASLASIVQAAQKVRNLFGAAKRASLAAKEAAANQRLASLSAAVDEAHAVTSTELANYQTAEQKLAWVTGVVTTHAEFPNGRLTDANLASLPVGATVIVGGWLSDDGLADYANEARRILDFQTGGTPKNFKVVFYTESVTSRSNDMYKPGTSLVKRAVDIAHAREELISVGYPAQRLPNAVNIDSMDGQSEEMLSRVQTILSAGNFDAVIPNNPTPETVALLRNNGVIVPMVLLEDTAKNPDLEQRALAFAQAGERVLVLNFAQGGDRAMQVKFGSPELQANEAVFSTYPNVSMHLGGNAPRILKEATLSVIPPVVLAKNNPTATVPASSVDSNPPALTLKTTLVPDTAVDATQPVTPPVPEAAPTTFQNLGTFAQMQQAGEAIAADLLDQWRALRPAQKLQPLSLIVAGPSAAELEATRVALNQAADIVFYQQLVPQRPVAEKSVQETVAAQPETMPAEGLPGSPSGVAVSAAPSPQRLFNQILAAFAAPAREPAVPAADAGQVTADAATPKLAFWNRVRMLLSWKSTLQPVATPEVTLAAQPPAETAVPIPATEISAATPAVETVSPSQPKLEVASTAVKAPVVKATAAIGPDDIVVLQAQLNKIADATEAMQKAGVEAKAVGARTVTMHGFFGMPTAEDEAVIAKNLRDLRAAFVKIQVAANAIASAQRAMVSEGVLSASHTAVLTTLADQLAPTQTSRAGDSIPQQMIAKVKAFEALPTFTITGSAKTKQTQKESFKTSLASFASQLESLTRANVAETNGIIASAIRNAPVLETVAKPVVAAGSSPEIAAPLNTEGVAVDITPGVDSAEVARIAQLYTQIKGVFDDMKKAGEELTKAKDRAPLRALPTVVIQIRALDTSVRQLTALVGGIVDSPVVDASMAKSLKEELGTIVANVGSMRSALSDVESHPLTSSYRTVLKDTLVEKGPATQIAGESLSVMLEGAIATAQRSVASHGPALTLKTTQVRTPPEVESAPAAPAVSTLTMPEVEAVAPQVVSAPPSTDPLGDALQGAFGAGGFVVGTRIGGVVGRVVANAVRATGAFLSGAVGSVSNTIASIAARVSSGSGSSSTPRPKTYSLNELKAFAADVERPQGKAEREAPSLVISRIDIYSYAEMTPEMKARITAEKPAAGHTFLYRGLRSVWHRPVLASSVMVSLEAQLSAIMEKSLTGALTEEDKQQLLVLTRLLPNERYQFFSDDVGVALKDAYFAEGGELVRIELTGDQAFAYQMDTPSSSSALNQGTNVIIPREAMLSEESAVAVAGRAAPSAETIPTPAASVPVDSAPVVESMPSVRPQPIETSSIAADLARGLLDLASEPAWTPDRPYAATPEPTTQKAPDDMISRLSAAQNTPPAAPVVAAPAQKSVPSLGAAAHPMLSAVWKYTPGSTSVTKTMTDTAAAADYIRGLLTGGISLRGLSWRSVATAAVSAVWNLLPGSASLTKTVTDMGAAADEAKVLLAKVTKAVSGSAASTGGLRATVPILSDFNPIDYELYREYPSISAAAAPVDLHVVGMTPDKTRVLVVGSEKGTPGRMVGLTGGSQVFALPANHAALDQNALASLHFTNERVADDAYAAATAPAAFVSSVGIPGASPAVVIPPPGGAEIGGTPPWRQWAYIILALLGASTIPQDTAVTVETPKAATSVKLAETAPATVKPSTVAKGGAAAPAPAAEAPAANCPPGSYCSAATPPPAAAPTPAPAAGAPAVPGVAGVPAKAAGATPPPAAGLPDASPDKTTPPAARGAGASAVDTGGGAGGGGEKGAGGAVAPAPASGARTPSAPGTTVTPGATKSPGTGSGTGAGTGGGLANSLGGFAQSLKNFFGLGQPSTPTAAATEAPAATPSTAVPATVATTQKPVVMFIVNPEEVAKGASPVLSWLSVNADGCAVYGPTGLLTPRRTERGTIRNLTIARPTEFALVCAATPNTLTDKKVVRVQGDTSTPVSAVITALPEKAAPAERASIPVSTSAPTTPSSAQSQSGGTPTQGAAQPRVQSCSPRMTSNGQVDQSYIDCLYQNGF